MRRFFSRRGLTLCLLVLAGCNVFNREPTKTLREMVEASNELSETLEKVHDVPSAEEVLPDLDGQFSRLIELTKKLPGLMRRYKNAKVSERLLTEMKDAQSRIVAVMERLKNTRGLPQEFWKVVKVRTLESASVAMELGSSAMLNLPAESMRQIQAFHQLLTVHGYEATLLVELNNLPPHLADNAKNQLQAAAPGATLLSFNEGFSHQVILAPLRDYRKFLAAVDLGQVVFEDEPQRRICIEVDRRKLDAEEARLRQEEMRKRIEETRKRMEEERLRREKERTGAEKNLHLPPPDDPQYYDVLARQLVAGGHFERQKAIRVLLSADPDQVPSAETRKKIARAFKQLAEDKRSFDREKAIQGLALWGGKYSVPILVKMLNTEQFSLGEKIIQVLGESKDPRAVDPLIERLGDFRLHQFAYNALLEIGSPAEDALLEVAPSENPAVCYAAVKLLGEVGTEKSLPLLREAINSSRNPKVRYAARVALRKITSRIKVKESAGP